MVELAVALPILLFVLFAIFEAGFILYDKAVITNASREGARQGIVYRANAATGVYQPYTAVEIQEKVDAYLDGGNLLVPAAAPSVTLPEGICAGSAGSLRVRVEYTYPFFILPNLLSPLVGPVRLVGETVMRCE